MSAPLQDRIGFIGAGGMGEAMIRGFLSSGTSTADRIVASVRSPDRVRAMASLGVRTVGNALEGGAAAIAGSTDIIFLAVKPVYMRGVLQASTRQRIPLGTAIQRHRRLRPAPQALAPHLRQDHLVVSVAAGLKLAFYEDELPAGTKVIRVMPNTPSLVGEARALSGHHLAPTASC